ncbi:Zinc finger MYND domain-containing protein 15 [Lamellibrachia satsuma]|nr:Zinc finger MYND domain-containing protein 15 [Lamellibrachia satsuma]
MMTIKIWQGKFGSPPATVMTNSYITREQEGCASSSGGGTVDDKVGKDTRDARERSPQPVRKLRGGKVTGRRETGRKETGRKGTGGKTTGVKERGVAETGGKEKGVGETGGKTTGVKERGVGETRAKEWEVGETGGKGSGQNVMEGIERKSYSAAVIEGVRKRARVFVGDSIVRKTDRVLNKGEDVVVCLPGAKIEAITERVKNIVGSELNNESEYGRCAKRCHSNTDHRPVRSCNFCQRHDSTEAFITCPTCQAVYYCSEMCRQQDLVHPNDDHGHGAWCSNMVAYLSCSGDLAHLPFTYAKETTATDFDEHKLKLFLERHDIYNRGYWQHLCPQKSRQKKTSLGMITPCNRVGVKGVTHEHGNTLDPVITSEASHVIATAVTPMMLITDHYAIESELHQPKSCPCASCITDYHGFTGDESNKFGVSSESLFLTSSDALVAPSVALRSWATYYEWRGFGFDSPIAALLQFPLTVYYIITLLPEQCADKPQEITSHEKQFTIHLLGVEQEAEMIPLFAELGVLLPDRKLCITMIGPKLSRKLHGKVIEMGNVKVTLHRGLYHTFTCVITPDVVIGLNAGLAAYPTWVDTLTSLSQSRTPAYFTDYCQYSCECSRLPLEALHLGTISEVEINPFRSPLRKYCEEHNMPWYSNAFVYHLVYTS